MVKSHENRKQLRDEKQKICGFFCSWAIELHFSELARDSIRYGEWSSSWSFVGARWFHLLLQRMRHNKTTNEEEEKKNQWAFLCFVFWLWKNHQIHFLQITNVCCNHLTFIFRHSLSVNHDSFVFLLVSLAQIFPCEANNIPRIVQLLLLSGMIHRLCKGHRALHSLQLILINSLQNLKYDSCVQKNEITKLR